MLFTLASLLSVSGLELEEVVDVLDENVSLSVDVEGFHDLGQLLCGEGTPEVADDVVDKTTALVAGVKVAGDLSKEAFE